MDAKIESHVLQNVPWLRLPADVRQHFGGNEKEYSRTILNVSIKHQLRWDGNLIKHLTRDREGYYSKVMQYSREHLMLFPYHLSKFIIREMRVTPFQYYSQIVQNLFETEQSYDQLPNFTAADCLRILGIGRNQYIEKMNQSRSKKSRFLDPRRRTAADVMPSVPVDDGAIEAWWIVQPGCILQDDMKNVTSEEKAMIDLILAKGPQKAGVLNLETLRKIFLRGLVYLDVPVNDDDCISVPPLEGFVMNRVLGDYLETLLYKVFVSIDEYTPVVELASVLQIDLEQVRNAISIFCRLGFAKVKGVDVDFIEMDRSWVGLGSSLGMIPKKEEDEGSLLNDGSLGDGSEFLTTESDPLSVFKVPEEEVTTPGLGPVNKRIGFMFDSTLTAFLMMGNLSPGLKNHAVTMFEVGKLADESLDSFLNELDKVVAEEELQGEAKRYFDHAINLREIIKFLRHNPALSSLDPIFPENSSTGYGVDLLRCESLRGLDKAALNRVLKKNYAVLVSLAAMSNEARPVCPLIPPHLGCPVPEAHSIWFKLFIYHITGSSTPTVLHKRGEILKSLPSVFLKYDYLYLTPWGHDSTVIPSSIAIALVNDALRHHSVLLQVQGFSAEPDLVYVPFPFRDSENESPTSFSSHPAVKVLREKLQLDHTCGYITLLNTNTKRRRRQSDRLGLLDSEVEPDSSQILPESENERVMSVPSDWVLLDCVYGLPVFSDCLVKECSKRILEKGTFSAENLETLEKVNRDVGIALLEFIIKNQSQQLVISTASGPPVLEKNGKDISALPTRSLSIHNGLII